MSNQPRVLWASHNQSTATGTDLHRLIMPAKHIGKVAGDTGIMCMLGTDLAQIGYKWIRDNGVTHIVVSRSITRFAQMHEQVRSMVADLQDAGVRLIVDIDDCPRVPPYHPSYEDQMRDGTTDHILESLYMADVIWCSTEPLRDYLADNYARLSNPGRIMVVPNALVPDEWAHTRMKLTDRNNTLRLGVMAQYTHWPNLPLLKDVFRKLRHTGKGSKWHVVACGVTDGNRAHVAELMGLRPDEVTFRPWMGINDYMEHYRHFDVLLAPLRDDYYNRCRSDLKVLECAMSNTRLIGSPVGGQCFYMVYTEGMMCNIMSTTRRALTDIDSVPVPDMDVVRFLDTAQTPRTMEIVNTLRMNSILNTISTLTQTE